MKNLLYYISVGALLCSAGVTNAAPIQVSYGDIIAATTEDFESSPTSTSLGTSYDFNGFTATVSEGNLQIQNISLFCKAAFNNCLINGGAILDTRTFDAFASGTNFFGFNLFPVWDGETADIFDVVVTGVSGISNFSISGIGLFGFGDTSGLLSIAITNLGTLGTPGIGNHAFDNVITGASLLGAEPTPVPVPGSMPLLAIGLGIIGIIRWRRRAD